MPDDPLDPLLHVGGLTVRLDVVVTQPDTQVLHIRLTQAVIKQILNFLLTTVYSLFILCCVL